MKFLFLGVMSDEYTPPVDSTPVDAADEAARLEQINATTGGGEVEIERNRRLLPKLPGL